MTNPDADRAIRRAAARARSRADRARRAQRRTGHDPAPRDRAVQVALENPPTIAAALAGAVGALFTWAIAATEFPIYVDTPLGVLGAAVAAFVGKVAQRWTYDRVGFDESVGHFVDDLHALGGTTAPPTTPHGP